ncbi:MAG: FHA domain-containing protein [bacterium]
MEYGTNAHPGGPSLTAPVGLTGFLIRGALALALLPLMLWMARRPRIVNRIDRPGFEVISPTEKRRFIPLEDRFQAMDFVNKIQTLGALRLSANLNKVTLSIRRFGYLMEDKNYRNALLVNRRRVRRTLLRNGDVLDLGDLTLLYRDHREPKVIRHASVTPGEGKSHIKFDRPKGPVRKGVGMLTSDQVSNRPFYLTKNVIYIGRSEDNDLTIKSRAVYYRHAKIEKVGGRYKMKDLSILGNTFVNNRRIEQRFLKDGDEISIEMHRFKFQIVSRTTGERPPNHRAPAVESEADAGRKAYAKEQEEEIEEQESALPS